MKLFEGIDLVILGVLFLIAFSASGGQFGTSTMPTISVTPPPNETPTVNLSIIPTLTFAPFLTPTKSPTPIMSPAPTLTSTLTPTPSTPSLPQAVRKVMVIDINPVLPYYGNQKLRQYKNWNNIDNLNSQFITDIVSTSNNYVRYQIVAYQEMTDFPVKDDGFQYTDTQYLACVNNSSQCHSPDIPSGNVNMYRSLLTRFQVCEKRNTGQIDEVWVWGGPWLGMFEAIMTGTNSWYTNGPVIPGSSCTKPLQIMAFNYERGIEVMEESFNHRIDGTLSHFFTNSWDMDHPHQSVPKNDWEKFTLINIDTAKPAACGDTHYPPNATSAYDFSNSTRVNSSCDDWLNYPNLTGATVRINCSAWNCDHRQYYVWRMSHIPKASGTNNGMNNNWWTYIVKNY